MMSLLVCLLLIVGWYLEADRLSPCSSSRELCLVGADQTRKWHRRLYKNDLQIHTLKNMSSSVECYTLSTQTMHAIYLIHFRAGVGKQ